jgi:hypothetical protein
MHLAVDFHSLASPSSDPTPLFRAYDLIRPKAAEIRVLGSSGLELPDTNLDLVKLCRTLPNL